MALKFKYCTAAKHKVRTTRALTVIRSTNGSTNWHSVCVVISSQIQEQFSENWLRLQYQRFSSTSTSSNFCIFNCKKQCKTTGSFFR